jgi:hypothetical protein
MTRSLRRFARRSIAPLLLALGSLVLVAARPPTGEDEVAAPRATLGAPGGAVEGSLGSNCVSNGVVEVCEEVGLALPARRIHVGPGAPLEMVVAGSLVTTGSATVVPAAALGATPVPVARARAQDGRVVGLGVPQGEWLLVVEVAFEPATAGVAAGISGEAAYLFHVAAGLPDTALEGDRGDAVRHVLSAAWTAWLVAVGGALVLRHRLRRPAH